MLDIGEKNFQCNCEAIWTCITEPGDDALLCTAWVDGILSSLLDSGLSEQPSGDWLIYFLKGKASNTLLLINKIKKQRLLCTVSVEMGKQCGNVIRQILYRKLLDQNLLHHSHNQATTMEQEVTVFRMPFRMDVCILTALMNIQIFTAVYVKGLWF